MRDDESDHEFLSRVAMFIDAVDVSALRDEWGSDVFRDVTTYAWSRIPCVVRRLSVLGARELSDQSPGETP